MIEKYQKTKLGSFQFLISRSPRNGNDIDKYQGWIDSTGLQGQFDAWIKLLDEYDTTSSFFDDPITQSYQDEFYAEFEIIDEDAEKKPLKTNQILLLDEYLEKVDSKLAEFITESNSAEIRDIQTDIKILRDNVTTKSKKWVVTKLTTIWAKMAKQGTKLLKEFLTETKKELIKQSIKGMIEIVKQNGQDLLNP